MRCFRKIIAIILFSVLPICVCAYAEVDLSSMSYDELVELKDKINLAIWESAEWQEVTVPQGIWIVGEDIPAGTWTLKCAGDVVRSEITWGDVLSEDGTSVKAKEREGLFVYVYNPDNMLYVDGKPTEHTVTLQEGDYVEISYVEGPMIFTPYAGKPSLGFH